MTFIFLITSQYCFVLKCSNPGPVPRDIFVESFVLGDLTTADISQNPRSAGFSQGSVYGKH